MFQLGPEAEGPAAVVVGHVHRELDVEAQLELGGERERGREDPGRDVLEDREVELQRVVVDRASRPRSWWWACR